MPEPATVKPECSSSRVAEKTSAKLLVKLEDKQEALSPRGTVDAGRLPITVGQCASTETRRRVEAMSWRR